MGNAKLIWCSSRRLLIATKPILAVAVFALAYDTGSAFAQSGLIQLEGGACGLEPHYEEAAFEQPMQFFSATSKGNMSSSVWVAAVGSFTAETPSRFREFMDGKDFPPSDIVFHSPGGNLGAGLELGRQIRARGMSTHIGRTVRFDLEADHPCRSWADHVIDGFCASSCAYAFLGGVGRFVNSPYYITPDSVLGYHQFWKDPEGSGYLTSEQAKSLENAALSTAQVVTGQIVLYAMDMGIDPRVVTLASTVGPEDLFFPTTEILESLGITTGDGLGDWFMEPYGAGLVAAVRGISKVSLFQQATAFCKIENSSQASLLVTMELNPYFTDPDDLPLDGLEITIDGEKSEVQRRDLSLRISRGLLYITARLSQSQRNNLLEAQHLKFQINGARVMGYFSVEGEMGEGDRKTLSLAWRNCV